MLVFGMNKMTNKHTPAPWTIDNCVDYIDIIDANKNTIVVVENDNQHNAKLIAAAPDLLGILQIMAEKDFEFSEYECRLARAAIAKATGEDID